MKHLESIVLVQYFLYERKDLELGINTAFLGPNGTGKTALLDALQIVLLAADSKRTHFNASGEGKRRARTLRDYCLGIYGQTEAERFRSQSNTYINLVFRDPDTGVPVTAGVSLAAQDDNPDVVFNSLYILPGIALKSDDHVESDGAREAVLTWRRFRQFVADKCRLAGTTPLFTTNRDEFSRELYVLHLASPGERPNVRAIRSAFARSLKLNKDVNDLSETLRDHLIEQRLTNVRQFHVRLQQFHEIREMVRHVKERIGRISEVASKYGIVEKERTTLANAACLAAVYEYERYASDLSRTEEAVETLSARLDETRTELLNAEQEARSLEVARDRALEERNQDPDYRQQANSSGRLSDREQACRDRQSELLAAIDTAISAATAAGRLPVMTEVQGLFEDALGKLLLLKRAAESGQRPASEDLQAASQAMAQVHEHVRKALAAAEMSLKVATEALRDAKTTMERAKQGLKRVRQPAQTLQRVLAEAGIQATPVCDLVRVTDASWQPALETYLASRVDALLVSGGQAREAAALDLYTALRGELRPYGVTLAFASRIRSQEAPAARQAAGLISGENEAAWYLQGLLNSVLLAENDQELLNASCAISRKGVVGVNGGLEQLSLPASGALVIGRGDVEELQLQADKALREAEEVFGHADRTAQGLKAVIGRLALFADSASWRSNLDRMFADVQQTAAQADELRELLAAAPSDQLALLETTLARVSENREKARKRAMELNRALGSLESELDAASRSVAALEKQLALARTHEATCRQDPLYKPGEVDRYRQRYDELHGENIDAKVAACRERIRKAEKRASDADHEGWTGFCQYAADFSLQNHDLTKAHWNRVFQYVLTEQQRLESLELVQREAEAEDAYHAAVKVFRTDVAQVLLEGFEAIEVQISGLNQVLKAAPEFSNGERYQFKCSPVEQHKALYDFLKQVREQGSEEFDIFGGSGRVPEEFRALVEGGSDSELLQDASPLNDHRRFFSYDVEIYHDGKSKGLLSKRFGPGSGGEHRTPLYVIFGAALAAAYGKSKTTRTSGGIIMLDEAFEKMDAQNVRATAQYLNALGLQMILAGPETDQPKMSSFLDVYYDMARYGSRTIQMTKNVILDEARELLQSDNFLLHPELLDREIATIEASEQHDAS